MIPALATIISAYITFRMIEVFALAQTRYRSRAAHIVIAVFAVIVILIVGFNMLNIYFTGVQATPNLSQP